MTRRKTPPGPGALVSYEVFARRSPEEALCHVGSVDAPNDHLAKVQAIKIYDEVAWVELCLVPSAAVVGVIGRPGSGRVGVV